MSYSRSPVRISALDSSANSNTLVLPTLGGASVQPSVLADAKMHASHIQIPVGSIIGIVSSASARAATAFSGYLMCDGTAGHDTTTYSALFAIIGYTFGGSGASFTLPSLNSTARTLVGRDDMGTTDAGRIGTANTRGTSTGAVTAASSVPAHNHAVTAASSHIHSGNSVGLASTVGGGNGSKATQTYYWGGSSDFVKRTGSTGQGLSSVSVPNWPSADNNSHSNTQPYLDLQWMIKF